MERDSGFRKTKDAGPGRMLQRYGSSGRSLALPTRSCPQLAARWTGLQAPWPPGRAGPCLLSWAPRSDGSETFLIWAELAIVVLILISTVSRTFQK